MNQRCQHSGPRGQCPQAAVDGSKFCSRHCNEADRLRGYRLSDTSLRARFDHFSDSESLETVRDEVILLRSLINERLDLAKTEADKVVAFQVIHPALSTLNKLVESLGKLERQTDAVLGKAALNDLCDEIAKILIEELCDMDGFEGIVDRIATRISDAIASAHNEK